MNDAVKLTRDLQRFCVTLLCVEWFCASLGFAVVLSSVRMIYGISINIRGSDFLIIVVPEILPSRGHIDIACEDDRLPREQLVMLCTSGQSGFGLVC